MSEIQVGQINSTDGSTAITTGADGYVSFAKTQIGGRRNLIINGAMQVAQRGTSFSIAHDGDRQSYPVDRFRFIMDTAMDSYDATVAQVIRLLPTTSQSLEALYHLRRSVAAGISSSMVRCRWHSVGRQVL